MPSAQVAPDLFKALAILSGTTVRRSAVDQEDLKPYLKSEKRPHFSRWSTILSFTSFSKTLLTIIRNVCTILSFTSFSKTLLTIIRNAAPDPFDKLRFIMTFLTILKVREILCSFKWVLEGKTGSEIPESSRLEFLESDAEDSTSRPLNRCGIADLPLLRTLLAICQKSPEPSFWEVMYSCFISICKFGSFKNPSAIITSLSELYFRSRKFILLMQTKINSNLNLILTPWDWLS